MLNFDWLSGVTAETARIVFFVLFFIIGVLVLRIPTEYIFQGVDVEDRRWYNNLKIWAIGVLAILSGIYYYF